MSDGDRHVLLVVHGVANRDPVDFRDEVDVLRARLPDREIQSVFWGDLGPPDPRVSFPMVEGSAALGDGALAPVADKTVVEHALADALVDEPEPASIVDTVRTRLRRIIETVDHLTPEALTISLRSMIARTVRDVEAYERNGEAIRARLDEAYRSVRADAARVDVLAHSLGSMVALEWLYGAHAGPDSTIPAERCVHTLVTFGAQVGLFTELRGLQGAPGVVATPPTPIAIRLRLQRWCNVWHAYDPLAFTAAPVFTVDGEHGAVAVEDYRLPVHGVPDSASFHTSYWRSETFLSWLVQTL